MAIQDISMIHESRESERGPIITDVYTPDATVTLYHGDRLDLLNQISTLRSEAELIVTSPPYNVGKDYEKPIPLKDYLAEQRNTIEACLGVLSPSGSICWQVGHFIKGKGKEKETFPLDIILYQEFKRFNLKLRNRIVWHFGHGQHENFRFSGRHETILWFTRDTAEYTFNLDAIRTPQKYPGKRAYRGPRKGQLSGNPHGKNPSDVWNIPNVKANHVEKTEHACQFPIALVARLILALTNEGDLVIDPYIGVGSTAIAAFLHGRRSAGADIHARYLEIARSRLEMARAGTLRFRPLDKPVFKPDLNTAVARVPKDWQ